MTLDMTTALVSNQLSSVTQKLESGLGISDDDDKARAKEKQAKEDAQRQKELEKRRQERERYHNEKEEERQRIREKYQLPARGGKTSHQSRSQPQQKRQTSDSSSRDKKDCTIS